MLLLQLLPYSLSESLTEEDTVREVVSDGVGVEHILGNTCTRVEEVGSGVWALTCFSGDRFLRGFGDEEVSISALRVYERPSLNGLPLPSRGWRSVVITWIEVVSVDEGVLLSYCIALWHTGLD